MRKETMETERNLKSVPGVGMGKPESKKGTGSDARDMSDDIMAIKTGLMIYAKGPEENGEYEAVRVGTVDHLDGESFIKLNKVDFPDGRHRWIPTEWVDKVDEEGVYLNKTEEEFQSGLANTFPGELQNQAV